MCSKPKIIVITPVRNEAWVLEAFLTHCSSWADRIIIADQNSTDGSREIAASFPKVTLIDNPTDEWIEYICRTSLLKEVCQEEGDKIIFALDADEFLSEGFQKTNGWKKILESTTNEIFCFRWFNLYEDFSHGRVDGLGAEWVAHYTDDVDIVSEYIAREQHAVHCARVPCLEGEKCKYTMIEDIHFVHLGNMNRHRMRNKLDFYQVVNIDKNPQKSSPLSMYRNYTLAVNMTAPIVSPPIHLTTKTGVDITPKVHLSDHGQHYIDEIVSILKREGYHKFRKLCIWDNPYLRASGISYSPPFYIRLLHGYLKHTQPYCSKFVIRVIDKILKKLI